MIHILFGHSEAGTLRYILKKNKLNTEQVITLAELFSVGPIWQLHCEAGLEARVNWMKNIIKEEFNEYQEYKQVLVEAINQIKSISGNQPVLIWTSGNASEQAGLRFVLYLLKDKTNIVKVINTTRSFDELFSKPNMEYVVRSSGEISPEKFALIYEGAKRHNSLEKTERNRLLEEWNNLSQTPNTLRIWVDDNIYSVPEDYYDQYMIDMAEKLHKQQETYGFMKSVRLIGDVMGNLEQYLGKGFLEYRLKKLIQKGVFEVEGSMKAMRFYSIMLKN